MIKVQSKIELMQIIKERKINQKEIFELNKELSKNIELDTLEMEF